MRTTRTQNWVNWKKKEKSARVLVHSIFILITGSKCTYFPNNGNASEITGFNTTLIKGQVRSKKCLICCRELYQNNQYFSSYRRISFGGPFDVGGVRWRHDIPSIQNAGLNEDNFGNIENFDILLFTKHNGLGCII